MSKMTLIEAIARSSGNKAKTVLHQGTDEQCTLIVQELDVMVFRAWLIEADWNVGTDKMCRKDCIEYLQGSGADPYAHIWLPIESDEDTIDPEELLSALQTAAYELGKDNGKVAQSDVLLRQEAQKTLEHLQHVLKRYRREISR